MSKRKYESLNNIQSRGKGNRFEKKKSNLEMEMELSDSDDSEKNEVEVDMDTEMQPRPIDFIGKSANGDEFFEGITWEEVSRGEEINRRSRTRQKNQQEDNEKSQQGRGRQNTRNRNRDQINEQMHLEKEAKGRGRKSADSENDEKENYNNKKTSVRLGDCIMVMLEEEESQNINLFSTKNKNKDKTSWKNCNNNSSSKKKKKNSQLVDSSNCKFHYIYDDDDDASSSSTSSGYYYAPAEILFIWRDTLEELSLEVRWLFNERDVMVSKLPLQLYQQELVETDSVSQIPVESVNGKIHVLSYEEYQQMTNEIHLRRERKQTLKKQEKVSEKVNKKGSQKRRKGEEQEDEDEEEEEEEENKEMDHDLYFIRSHYSTKYRCSTSLNNQDRNQRRQRGLSYSFRAEDCPSSLINQFNSKNKDNEENEEESIFERLKLGKHDNDENNNNSNSKDGHERRGGQSKNNKQTKKQPRMISGRERLDLGEELLHATRLPTFLPCREREWEDIKGWVQASIKGAMGQALYICGAPGTGKTATVLVTMRDLREARDRGEMPPFRFVEINALKLSNPTEAYTVLHEAVFKEGKKKNPQAARDALMKYFTKPSANKPVIVLLLDEMDYLVTQNQKVLYSLLGEWPRMKYSKLVVVGISNTFDLLERAFPRTQSRIGINRINFMPYQHEQIARILNTRLSLVKGVLSEDAINLCSRKTASNLGDVRKAFQLSRLAINRCRHRMEAISQGRMEAISTSTSTSSTEKRLLLDYIVTSGDMREADRELNDTPLLQAIRNASFIERIVLVAMASQIYASGREYTIIQQIKERTDQIIAQEVALGARPCLHPSYTNLLLLVAKLARQGLVDLRMNLSIHWSPIVFMHVEPITIAFNLRGDRIATRYLHENLRKVATVPN